MLLEHAGEASSVGNGSEAGLDVSLDAGVDEMGDVFLGETLDFVEPQRLVNDGVEDGKGVINVGTIDYGCDDRGGQSKRVGDRG